MGGWIKFYRELLDHPLVGFKKPYSKAEAWIWMLSQSRFEDTKEYRDFGGKERLIDMPRGTLTHSIRFMSKAFGWSTSKLINFLKTLENDSQITQKTIQQITQITICNYNSYQGDSAQQPIQQRYSRNTAEIQQKNEIKNDKYDKNGKNLLEREKKFASELNEFLNNPYDKEMLLGFYEYWTEANKTKTKLRFELEKTWDIKKRLSTWDRRGKMMRGINEGNSRSKDEIIQSAKERYKRVFGVDGSDIPGKT